MIWQILLAIVLSVLLFNTIFLIRNNQVYLYRMGLIDRIHTANLRDIDSDVYQDAWRWRQYEAVSYESMLWKFWKPLSSFYDEEALIRGLKTGSKYV